MPLRRLLAFAALCLPYACSPSFEKPVEPAPNEGTSSSAGATRSTSPGRTKSTATIRRALDAAPDDMRGQLAAQALSEVEEYPLTPRERRALSFAAGRDVEPSQCERVLAALVSELDAPLVEKPCGDRAALMKALSSAAPEKRLDLAQKRCKVTLDNGQKARSTAMAVVVSAAIRQQLDADPASSDDERWIASFVAQACHR